MDINLSQWRMETRAPVEESTTEAGNRARSTLALDVVDFERDDCLWAACFGQQAGFFGLAGAQSSTRTPCGTRHAG
jgi:hypothetical protein